MTEARDPPYRPPVSEVEAEYRRRTFAMPAHVKMARAASMYGLGKSNVARRLAEEHGPMSERRLQLMVARHLYQREPQVRAWLDEELERVPD